MVGLVAKECAVCAGRFSAKRDTAKYCSERCRKRAQRQLETPSGPAALPARREGAAVVALQPQSREGAGLYGLTRAALDDAGRLETPRGQAVMLMTEILTSGVQDTGSSIASLIKTWDAMFDRAMDGVSLVVSPLEIARRARESRGA